MKADLLGLPKRLSLVLIVDTEKITNRRAWLKVCHDSGMRSAFFNQAERNKSCWTEDRVGRSRPSNPSNAQPRLLYSTDKALRLLPCLIGSRSMSEVGGKNCRERAMTWNKSAGKYSSLLGRFLGWPIIGKWGTQSHHSSSWLWKKCGSTIEYCQSFTLSKKCATRPVVYAFCGRRSTSLSYWDFRTKSGSEWTDGWKKSRSLNCDCNYECISKASSYY